MKLFSRLFMVLVALVFVSGCAHSGGKDSCEEGKEGSCDMKEHSEKKKCCGDKGSASEGLKIEQDQKIGSSKAVLVNGHLMMGAAPKDLKDFQAAKEQGIKLIVDLREDKEFKKKSVQKAVTEQGLVYVQIPMSKKGKIEKDALDKIELAVHKDGMPEKAWIVCASGNRGAAWLAVHAVSHHKLTQEEALKSAESAGLKPDMKAKVEEYWKKSL